MFKYSVLDNGIDSLQAAEDALTNFCDEERIDGGIHFLKDAILSLSHSIEILFKYLLSTKNEALIFEDQKKYMQAKKEVAAGKAKNVFEVDPNLKTVYFKTVKKRIASNTSINFDNEFSNLIAEIRTKRNSLEHYGLELNEEESETLYINIRRCYVMALDFFKTHIEGFDEKLKESRYVVYQWWTISDEMADRARQESEYAEPPDDWE